MGWRHTWQGRKPLADFHQQFLGSLKAERGASRETVSAYASDLRLFCRFISQQKHQGSDLRCFTAENLRDFQIWLSEQGKATATIRRRMHGLSSFSVWLVRWDALPRNPFDRLVIPKRVTRARRYLHLPEVRLLLALRLVPSHAALRAVLLYGGFRLKEVIGLDWCHLDFGRLDDEDETGFIQVTGKGNAHRVVPMTLDLRAAVEHYLLSIGPQAPATPVFKGAYGRRIGRHVVRAIVRSWGEAIGRPDLRPHLLRHTLATYLSEKCPLRQVQAVLGHECIETTTIYAHVRPVALRHSMGQFRYGVEPELDDAEQLSLLDLVTSG